jgi:hypothetical protein
MLPPDGTQNDEASEQLAGRSRTAGSALFRRLPRQWTNEQVAGNVIRKHIMDDALGVQRHIS